MTQRTFGHWLWLAPFGITSAGAKALHLHLHFFFLNNSTLLNSSQIEN